MSLTAPLNPPSISSSSTPSDSAYVQLPADTAATSSASITSSSTSHSPSFSSSSSSSFLIKLQPYRRYLIAASILLLLLLLIPAYLSFSHSGPPFHGSPFSPSDNTDPSTYTADNSTCTRTKIETEGPYWVDEKLNRSDLAATATGLNLALELLVFNTTVTDKCVPVVGAMVDVWHSDALGLYSDEQVLGTKGKTFLRGYQLTNADGIANFLTVYPGWYSGRTVHLHVRVRVYDASGKVIIHNQTSQLFFDDTINDAVMSGAAPYNTRTGKRDTYNNRDNIFDKSLLVNLTGNVKSGYSGSFAFGVPFVR